MGSELGNGVRVTPSTKIRFKCSGCGECCRHVKESVPASCQDAFYLTKHLRDIGLDICCVDQFLSEFAEPALLDECGFFVYFLKSVGEDDSCIFLKENRCAVQNAKPLACHCCSNVRHIYICIGFHNRKCGASFYGWEFFSQPR